MNIEVVAENAFARKVEIKFPSEVVQVELDSAYREYERKARLPGFRQGKVPRRVLEARFGDGIAEEVAEKLVQRGWLEAMTSHGIEPVGRPELVKRGVVVARAPFEFVIGVEVKPEVEVKTYQGLPVRWPKASTPEEEVEKALEQARSQQARLAAVDDRPVEMGDTVQVALTGSLDGEVILNEPGTLIRTGGELWLKGLESSLLGPKIGDSQAGPVTFDAEARNEDVAGKTLDCEVTVLSIQALETPELTDDLAVELGHDSLEAWRTSIREELAESGAEQARNVARARVLEALIEANPIEVPRGMVEQNLEMLKDELRYQAAWRGEDFRNLQFTDAQLARMWEQATFATRAGLLIDSVGRAEGIEATDEMVEARIQELATSRGQEPEAVRSMISEDGNLDGFRDRLREEAIIDWLLDQAEVTEVDPAEEAAAQEAAEATESAEAPVESPVAVDEAGAADTSILDLSIGDLKSALASGDHDATIPALLEAEQAGRNRKGALAALRARQS